MTSYRKKRLLMLILLIFVALSPLLWRSTVKWYYDHAIHPVVESPDKPVAIVFGAAVYWNGRLSSVLRDRMDTAIDLYQTGKVQKLLLSGDNSTTDYNEPDAMMAYAISQGVPAHDIQPDYGGRRTYDTCYRARHIFHVQSAVLVTQQFHLPRAIFTCRRIGIDGTGVAADLRPYRGARWYEIRETAATFVALWDVILARPSPVLGEPIPIGESTT